MAISTRDGRLSARVVLSALALTYAACATTKPASEGGPQASQADAGAIGQDAPLAAGQALDPRLTLIHRNDMGRAYILQSVSYSLDGAVILSRVAKDNDLDSGAPLTIFDSRVSAGEHVLAVRLDYRGALLSPLIGYRFQIAGTYRFKTDPGKATTVIAVGYESTAPATAAKDRPKLRYEISAKREADNAAVPRKVEMPL